MRLLADLHTHTIASGHAYSTVTENALAAAAVGIELIAITDHGPAVPQGSHPWYFWNLKSIPSVLNGVRILKGCEANLSADSENGLDLPDVVIEKLDFVAVGLHPLTGFDQLDRDKNTAALLRAMANPLVDQVTHPGNEDEFPLHLDRIIEAALTYNVILELNDHSFDLTSARSTSAAREREFATAALEAGVPVSVGSDSHYALHIGHFEKALAVAEEIGFTRDRIVNRDAESVLAHLLGKRERTRLDHGGEWTWPAAVAAGAEPSSAAAIPAPSSGEAR